MCFPPKKQNRQGEQNINAQLTRTQKGKTCLVLSLMWAQHGSMSPVWASTWKLQQNVNNYYRTPFQISWLNNLWENTSIDQGFSKGQTYIYIILSLCNLQSNMFIIRSVHLHLTIIQHLAKRLISKFARESNKALCNKILHQFTVWSGLVLGVCVCVCVCVCVVCLSVCLSVCLLSLIHISEPTRPP